MNRPNVKYLQLLEAGRGYEYGGIARSFHPEPPAALRGRLVSVKLSLTVPASSNININGQYSLLSPARLICTVH